MNAALMTSMSNREICTVLRGSDDEVVRMLVDRLEEVMYERDNAKNVVVAEMGGELKKRNYGR